MPAIISSFTKKGEEREKAAKEARENLKIVENGLGEKRFFGGDTIGFVDIAAGWIGYWARITEEVASVNLINAETTPILNAWFDILNAWFERVLEFPVIKECLPPRDKLLEHSINVHKVLTAGST